MSDEKWVIEPLERGHSRTYFDCGEPAPNEFLKKRARQQQDKRFSKTFVAINPDDKAGSVIGFYTLSAGELSLERLPQEQRKKLPKHPVPVARLGRLAVDQTAKGKGLGVFLLRHALIRCAEISKTEMGIYAVLVDAKNEGAIQFYKRYGFFQLQDTPSCLYIPIKTILNELPN